MGIQTPQKAGIRRMPRDQRVAAIMDTARIVLREKGYEQFSTADVAERCGISEGTIYKYFVNRRDLMIQVAEAWYDELTAQERVGNENRPIRERLYLAISNHLLFIRREPQLTRFILLDLRADPAFRETRVFALNRQVTGWVLDVVEDGVRTGELRSDFSRKILRNMIFGYLEHQVWAFLRGEGDFSLQECAEEATDLVLRGIGVQSPAAPEQRASDIIGRMETMIGQLQEELASLKK
ncbi:MAG: TetR/AcrR family transcriptional regulator [Rhodobiaceae bacterium]|nr:TetR/AcrR family transcriptional regulator [Rhodobiaceae bacterium]MCC0055967.1 TetR/AcrR family transcriptional regulator [Rhodobiaceae bacterium]